jgi:hypothetical protein
MARTTLGDLTKLWRGARSGRLATGYRLCTDARLDTVGLRLHLATR